MAKLRSNLPCSYSAEIHRRASYALQLSLSKPLLEPNRQRRSQGGPSPICSVSARSRGLCITHNGQAIPLVLVRGMDMSQSVLARSNCLRDPSTLVLGSQHRLYMSYDNLRRIEQHPHRAFRQRIVLVRVMSPRR